MPLLAIDTHTTKNTPTNDDNIASPQLFQPLTVTKFLITQASDTYCRMGHTQVGRNNSKFDVNNDGLHVRSSRVDGALSVVVPPPLRERIIILSHHPPITGLPGQFRLYDTL